MRYNNERYSRQLILQGFGEPAQSRLADARVLVIGAGGLGCPALQYLVSSGVGSIGIIDDDIVSVSNLHRQVLFTTDDIGRLKVEVSSERLQRINPEVDITIYPFKIDSSNVIEVLNGYDFIFDGSDNFTARYLVNDASTLLKKPLIFAAVSGYEGQLAIFNIAGERDERTNYRDLFPIQPKDGEILNCAENGVLGVLPGIIGAMAAGEIIKLITKIGRPLINTLRHYNLLSGEQYEMNISPGANYTLPKTKAELSSIQYGDVDQDAENYTEISAIDLKSLREQSTTLVIDVRERHEYPKLHDKEILPVPLSELESLLAKDISEQNIVFLCQHGIRSATAAELFNEKYGDLKNIYSVKGGITKWSNYF
ncbi:molybdopterin biosynthesis protein [Pedobacter frigidisoli]|uniref:Molybdopterin biosynthesis protein n=1 Tax=Pedobacter frigidisoli TaxID=2530455 RepID=A0A4R0NYS8_9SPHI|nr:HesA/MoeB/ThiF family protein [Pedobacter frigidisoli]TCD07599.1 molybdopterin biosynthesis protein [Pedobacter frigidisoli]